MPNLPSGKPLDFLPLRADMARRLTSTGGRLPNHGWKVQHLAPFAEARWRQLKEPAKELSSNERKVGPGQLATILIEDPLNATADAGRQR